MRLGDREIWDAGFYLFACLSYLSHESKPQNCQKTKQNKKKNLLLQDVLVLDNLQELETGGYWEYRLTNKIDLGFNFSSETHQLCDPGQVI